MQEINLLQNKFKDTTAVWETRNKVIITGLVLVLIAEFAASGIFFIFNRSYQQKAASLTLANADLQSTLNSKQTDLAQAKAFQAQLKNVNRLVNSHLWWSNLFDELSKQTYNKAYFVNFRATPSGQVHLEGKVKSYTDLGKLLLGLSTSKDFSNVKLLSTTPSPGKESGLIFSLDMLVNASLFINQK